MNCPVWYFPELRIWKVGECRCGNSLQKLKQLQPESKNIVLTGLTGEALGEKRLYQMESWYGHLLQGDF